MPNGRPTGPPEPKSVLAASSAGALRGLKKSLAVMAPPEPAASRTTASPSWPGGLVPGPGGGDTPLPVEMKIRPGPSDISPPPDCQMPPSWPVTPASSVHSRTALVAKLTLARYPA